MKARAHVYISGRVQGVFFRSKTKQEAIKHNLTGWIRNIKDGRVEAVFEGEENNVRKIIEYCYRGTPLSKVVNVEVLWEAYTGKFSSFKILWLY